MLRSLKALDSADYQTIRCALATIFHVAMLTDSDRNGNPTDYASAAAAHADAHLTEMGIVDPDTVA